MACKEQGADLPIETQRGSGLKVSTKAGSTEGRNEVWQKTGVCIWKSHLTCPWSQAAYCLLPRLTYIGRDFSEEIDQPARRQQDNNAGALHFNVPKQIG